MAVNPPAPSTQSAPPPRGVNPLVRQLGLGDLAKRDAAQQPPAPADVFDEPAESSLTGHVRLAWQRNKLAKERIDQKLLACLRARRGVYSPAEINALAENGGTNFVFTDLTETKCRAASAWIREIVLPVGEQPWGVDPTPLPDLPRPIKDAVVKKAMAQAKQVMIEAQQAGGGVMAPDEFRDLAVELGEKLRTEAEQHYQKAAKRRAKRMERQIADRLAQGNYAGAMDGFIEDFVTYPAAILKGPIYKRHKTLAWGAGFKPIVKNDPIQWWDRVSPFDIYPAPGSTSPQQGDFIERIRFRRDELHDLKGVPGFKDDQIDDALRDYSAGHMEGWLWTEAERQRLEQETLYMWLSPEGVIDALNYWGSIPGWKLISWGVEGITDETREYECNVVLCGRYVLYAALNPDPLHQRPYRKACYDEIPGAFWGRSIPDLAATSQKMCNATACSLADNLGLSSGPQFWVHADRFADGEQTIEVRPHKVWQLKSDSTQGVNPGIGVFEVPSNAAELMGVFEKWELKADDATGIPRYTYGNERAGGSADTASGLSMLMTNAAKGLRRGIGNIDANVISLTIGDTFTNEMLYNPDESIKGDCIVVPRGAAAILIREAMQQRRLQYLTIISNPLIAQTIGPKYLVNTLREVATAMELPVETVVPTDEDFEQMQAQQAQQMQAQVAAAQQAEQAKLEGQLQIELAKDERAAAREQSAKTQEILGGIVKEAVAAALAKQQGEKSAGSKKRVKYEYNDAGELVAGEVED